MSNLRICNAVSLHPRAASTAMDDIQPYQQLCVLGCLANKSELCQFPVQDVKRCNNWLRHFGVSDQLVQELGGLKKLRICFKHFNQHKQMAKTRIKMTPLRTAKSVFAGSAAAAAGVVNKTITTTAKSTAPSVDSTTVELIDHPNHTPQKLQQQKQQQQQQLKSNKPVTTITPVPQRSHSICSSASSDVQSISSDYESSMPLSTLLNGNASQCSNSSNPKKRKLYVITEKSDKLAASNSSATPPQKRKMFVVVEEENETKAKKLMFVTDKPPQGNISGHLEKFLPEILSCIQDKQQAKQQQEKLQEQESQKPVPLPLPLPKPAKPHITLPPKKNPTNFVKAVTAAAAAPIMPPAMPPSSNHHNALFAPLESDQGSEYCAETNINLSPDFRFLMKILPKLEQLPEQHKQNVKRSIQIFVEKSYSMYVSKE